jgi:hypothetical protein
MPTGQFRRVGFDIAAVDLDVGVERAQALDVQVDRPDADDAATRQRDLRLAALRDQPARARRSTRASG